jgi:hypothetical protein
MIEHVDIYVVLHKRCKSIVRKSIDRKAKVKETVQKSIAVQARMYHRGQEFIASDFSSKDPSQGILRFEMQKQAYQAASQELHPALTSTKQPSRN